MTMDAQERKLKLFEKAQANSQRRKQEEFLASLPEPLASVLTDVDTVYFPEVDSLVRQYFPVTDAGFGVAKSRPPSYSFCEVALPNEALAAFDQGLFSGDPRRAWLGLSAPSVITFQDSPFLVPSLPIFRVQADFVIQNLRKFWDENVAFISLVAEDCSRGIVVDNYSGYLDGVSEPHETVFEVATWMEAPYKAIDGD